MNSEISHYERLGGAKSVRQLVDRFYDLMDEKDDVKALRQLHAKSLRVSREKLFLFLSGWLGGPPLYVEKYGHPRLRQRHMPFAIGTDESKQWMLCINQALDEQVKDVAFKQLLKDSFQKVATHMINK